MFARGLVGPGFVAHDDLEQLVHGLGPLTGGHEQTGFGQAGVEVAFVFVDQGVKLRQFPLAALVGGGKHHGLQPVVQRVKAQLQGDLRQRRGQGSVGGFQLAHGDEQLHIVKAGFVVGGVDGQGLLQLGQGG